MMHCGGAPPCAATAPHDQVACVCAWYQGCETIGCNLYLWNQDTKVVISDVDGTITKSDIMGHIMYYVGRDWTHVGVASLYTNIKVGAPLLPTPCFHLIFAPVHGFAAYAPL